MTIYLPPALFYAVGVVVVWTVVAVLVARLVAGRHGLSSRGMRCFRVIGGPVVWAVALWDWLDQLKVRRAWVAGEADRERRRKEDEAWR